MQQIRNSQEYLNGIQGTVAEFRKSFDFINKKKNDDSGIFRDVKSGKDNLFTIDQFSKDTASDSIYYAVYSDDARFFSQPRTAFVKVYINDEDSEGMRVETCMYKNHVNDTMVNKMQTPNLVYYYGTVSGYDLGNYTSGDIYSRGRQAFKGYPRQSLSMEWDEVQDNVIFNFTEYIPTTNKISKFVNEDRSVSFSRFSVMRAQDSVLISDKDYAQALFQLVYTLWIFEMNGIYHNDIHDENVLVVKNTSNREFIYTFEDEGSYNLVYTKPKYIVKIFDYDRGYDDKKLCYPKAVNGEYDQCYGGKEPYADCYYPNRRGYDFIRFLTSAEMEKEDVELFFEKKLTSVMKKFDKLKRSKQKDLEAIGIKPMKEYIYRMLINNITNGWFENATTDQEISTMLTRHKNAELYSYDMKKTEKFLSQIQPDKRTIMRRPTKRRRLFKGRKLLKTKIHNAANIRTIR